MKVNCDQIPALTASLHVHNDSKLEREGSDMYLHYECGCKWRPGTHFGKEHDSIEFGCFRHEVLAIHEMETSKRK